MINIRPMIESDTESVVEMMNTFYHSPAVLSDGSEEIYRNDVVACVSDCPFLEGYILEADGQLAGYSMTAKSFSTEFGKPCIWIEDLYIKPEYRGLGLGSKMLQYIDEKYPDMLSAWKQKKIMKRLFTFTKNPGLKYCPM